MSISNRRHVLAALTVFLLSRGAAGQGIPTPGIPNCLERCELSDPRLLTLARSTCALVAKSQMFPNRDGTYTLVTQSSTTAFGLCPDSPWAGQPTFLGGRTGCLVGEDLVLTAAHGVLPTDTAFCASGWYFVFDYAIGSDTGECVLPAGIVPAELVYECAEIVRHGAYNGDVDMLLVRLDRPVTGGRAPIPVRRSGEPIPGDPIACVHHPDRLPAKTDTAASFVELVPTSSIPEMRFTGINAVVGTSGAALFNVAAGVIESVVIGGSCISHDTTGGCLRLGTDCAQNGSTDTWGDSIVDFARHVDPYELTIESQATVGHEGPSGGPLTNPVTTYRISAPPRAPGRIGIRAEVLVNRYGDYPGTVTAELQMPNLEKRAFLWPGESADLIVRVDQGKMPAGIGSVMVAVTNQANDNVDVLLHEFRVGVTGFVAVPAELSPIVEPAPPFQRTQLVTLTNPEANPVDVRVSANAAWITIDGKSGDPGDGGMAVQTFHLSPAGQPGHRVDVAVGAQHAPGVVYPGVSTGTIDLVNLDTGPFAYGELQASVVLDTRSGDYDVGTFVPIPDGNPRGLAIDVPVEDGFCIADLNVLMFVNTTHADEIQIDLRAPSGTSIRLWDRNPSDELSILFDDEGWPPPTGALLSAFDGQSAAGVWTLTIRDLVPGNPTFLNVSRLQFQSAGLCP